MTTAGNGRLDCHRICYAGSPEATAAWLKERGYRAAPAGVPGCFQVGVVFSRGNEPARLAVMDETLVFDGHEVTVH